MIGTKKLKVGDHVWLGGDKYHMAVEGNVVETMPNVIVQFDSWKVEGKSSLLRFGSNGFAIDSDDIYVGSGPVQGGFPGDATWELFKSNPDLT